MTEPPKKIMSPSATDTTARVRLLEQCFEQIARTRMADIPMLNPALRVAAVGFAPDAATSAESVVLTGVLVTPWFMNLVRLPLAAQSSTNEMAAPGVRLTRRVGSAEFDFLGCSEAALGAFEACSLFSPMFEFQDQAAAVATAQAVLGQLRAPAPGAGQAAPASPARRGFLFGRSAARAGAAS